jgi:hypothetical protein
MVLLHLFLTRTVTGSTIVAMAQNREGAALVGIDATRVTCCVRHLRRAGRHRRHALRADQPGLSEHGQPGHHQGVRDHHPRRHGQHPGAIVGG